jgi:hypothetical protein
MAGAFLDLVSENQVGQVTVAIERAVIASFEADRGPMTRDEIRRRFAICERVIRELRGDLGCALARVLDHLPRYLRCELDGVPWTPETRVLWTPDDTNI